MAWYRRIDGVSAMRKTLSILVAFYTLVWGVAAFGQTATPVPPTATPVPPTATETPTSTPTATPTLGRFTVGDTQHSCQPTRFCAWKYGTVAVDFTSDAATITLPGIQPKDFIFFYAYDDGGTLTNFAWKIVTNNTISIVDKGGTIDDENVTLEFVWWDRTYVDLSRNMGD